MRHFNFIKKILFQNIIKNLSKIVVFFFSVSIYLSHSTVFFRFDSFHVFLSPPQLRDYNKMKKFQEGLLTNFHGNSLSTVLVLWKLFLSSPSTPPWQFQHYTDHYPISLHSPNNRERPVLNHYGLESRRTDPVLSELQRRSGSLSDRTSCSS